MSKTSPTESRVKHYVESAERCHAHDLHGARDRFISYALDILNTKRVRNAGVWRERTNNIGDTTC